MLKSAVNEVEQECRRVLDRIKSLKRSDPALKSDDRWYGSAETAALRRASMDLTKSLAKMRKS